MNKFLYLDIIPAKGVEHPSPVTPPFPPSSLVIHFVDEDRIRGASKK